jgi:transcriptional regulator with XRE-family HTH domain
MNDFYTTIGTNIRTIRKARGMSQEQLAAGIGLLRTSVANIEAGRQRVPLHTLEPIAAALNVTVGALLPAEWLDNGAVLGLLRARIAELEEKHAQLAELAEWLYRETR